MPSERIRIAKHSWRARTRTIWLLGVQSTGRQVAAAEELLRLVHVLDKVGRRQLAVDTLLGGRGKQVGTSGTNHTDVKLLSWNIGGQKTGQNTLLPSVLKITVEAGRRSVQQSKQETQLRTHDPSHHRGTG